MIKCNRSKAKLSVSRSGGNVGSHRDNDTMMSNGNVQPAFSATHSMNVPKGLSRNNRRAGGLCFNNGACIRCHAGLRQMSVLAIIGLMSTSAVSSGRSIVKSRSRHFLAPPTSTNLPGQAIEELVSKLPSAKYTTPAVSTDGS